MVYIFLRNRYPYIVKTMDKKLEEKEISKDKIKELAEKVHYKKEEN